MFKSITTYKVSPSATLKEILPNGLPVNAFIDKGRCGIGGSFSEITNKTRSTIMTVPNISIEFCKKLAHPEIDIVYGNIGYEKVYDMLAVKKPGHKILATPEGIWKIMMAAESLGRLEELHREWFLLLDECHTFISELYREDILRPFEYFWDFDQKSIISATPYFFSDERFYTLDHHKITFTEPLGTVHLINAKSVTATLNYFVEERDEFPGNLHIFYNSVTEIADAIKRSNLEECNIFCADDKDHKNKTKLGDLVKHFVSEPTDKCYKKVNFYTSKYFEGWDMYDKNATMILVTNVHKSHTRVGVGMKGKQAVGRIRQHNGSSLHKIYHITNHGHHKIMKPLVELRKEYTAQAQVLLQNSNSFVNEFPNAKNQFKENPIIVKFADVDKVTKLAAFNSNKLDQQINEAANNEIYNHIDFIEQDWKDNYYDVVVEYSDLTFDTKTVIKRKSASKQLEEDYLKILDYQERKQQSMIFSLGRSPEEQIRDTNPTAYLAAKHLDKTTMQKLKYNVKNVQAELILNENTLAEVRLLKLLNITFKIGSKYSNKFIKSKLQEFYTKLNIRDEKTGKIRVATASQLAEPGRFEINEDKVEEKGKRIHGQLIIRAQFSLKMAA